MTRSDRLRPIVRLAQRRRDDAAQAYRMSREELSSYRDRLAQMRAYREEYVARFLQAGNGGMTARRMKDYRRFLVKLDEVIAQIERLAVQAELAVEARKGDWVARRARVRALDEAIARFRFDEVRELLRGEQRESDDRSQRRR